jgi:hypothetical protein
MIADTKGAIMLTCLLIATGLLVYLAFCAETPPVTINVHEGGTVHIHDGGAVSLRFGDFRESIPGSAGVVDNGQHGGATTIVDDTCPSGTIGGQSDGRVGWHPITDQEAKLLRRLREVDYSMTFMTDTVTLVLRWAIVGRDTL